MHAGGALPPNDRHLRAHVEPLLVRQLLYACRSTCLPEAPLSVDTGCRTCTRSTGCWCSSWLWSWGVLRFATVHPCFRAACADLTQTTHINRLRYHGKIGLKARIREGTDRVAAMLGAGEAAGTVPQVGSC